MSCQLDSAIANLVRAKLISLNIFSVERCTIRLIEMQKLEQKIIHQKIPLAAMNLKERLQRRRNAAKWSS